MPYTRVRLVSQRLISAVVATAVLTSCGAGGIANLQHDIALAAQQQLKQTLASHYTRELGKGVSIAMTDLAQVGGYLDNPLVRILLPPPLGIALGVARDLQANPQAAVLETLMNRAAEQVVPGAAPILQTAIAQITPTEARALLDGGSTAGTDYLKQKTSDKLRATLTPLMLQQLGGNGAEEIYSTLLAAPAAADTAAPATTTQAASPNLSEYVTEKTIDGMFKNLGVHEASLRDNLDAATGGLIQSTAKPTPPQPITAVPMQATPIEAVPVNPVPVEPTPVETVPLNLVPVNPVPLTPVPVNPVPVNPVPVNPVPVNPAPLEAAPAEPSPGTELNSKPVDSIWM